MTPFIFFALLSLVVTFVLFVKLCEMSSLSGPLRVTPQNETVMRTSSILQSPPVSLLYPHAPKCTSLHTWIQTYDIHCIYHCAYSGWKSWIVLDAWLEYDLTCLRWQALASFILLRCIFFLSVGSIAQSHNSRAVLLKKDWRERIRVDMKV